MTPVSDERAFLVYQFLPTIIVEESNADVPEASFPYARGGSDMRKSGTMPDMTNIRIPPPRSREDEVSSASRCSCFFSLLLKAFFYLIARRRRGRGFAYP